MTLTDCLKTLRDRGCTDVLTIVGGQPFKSKSIEEAISTAERNGHLTHGQYVLDGDRIHQGDDDYVLVGTSPAAKTSVWDRLMGLAPLHGEEA